MATPPSLGGVAVAVGVASIAQLLPDALVREVAGVAEVAVLVVVNRLKSLTTIPGSTHKLTMTSEHSNQMQTTP